jgi:hypothetical protein
VLEPPPDNPRLKVEADAAEATAKQNGSNTNRKFSASWVASFGLSKAVNPAHSFEKGYHQV